MSFCVGSAQVYSRAEAMALPRRIFSPIARHYDGPAQALCLFQYRRWRRFLLSRLPLPHTQARGPSTTPLPARPDPPLAIQPPTSNLQPPALRILDMATGTGALALDLIERPGIEVIGADVTRPMLLRAAVRRPGLGLVEATAEASPFRDEAFDAVVFAYLMRYVSDVPATLRELARLVRPGGVMASLDFAVPGGVWHPAWRLYTGLVLPAAGRVLSPAWGRTAAFLGPSIRGFYRRWPEPRLLGAWRDAGFPDVQSRRLSLGGAIVIWGTKAG